MRLLRFIIIFHLLACSNSARQTSVISKPLNSKDTIITLKDTLGDISITIPNRYDTFLIWTHNSDCSKCGSEKYRFQPKRLPIFKESGFFWDDPKDSIDQLTIEHPQFIRIIDTVQDEIMNYIHAKMKVEASSDPLMYQDKSHFDTVQRINNMIFSIITAEHYDDSSKLFSKAVLGTTLIKGNQVVFKFALLTSKKDSITDNFIENSKQLLFQIKTNGL